MRPGSNGTLGAQISVPQHCPLTKRTGSALEKYLILGWDILNLKCLAVPGNKDVLEKGSGNITRTHELMIFSLLTAKLGTI